MDKNRIEKSVNASLESLDGIQRATAKPFLLTRVMAKVNGAKGVQNLWTKAGAFISRPAIAIAGIFLFLLINTGIIIFSSSNDSNKSVVVQSNNAASNEFAVNTGVIYDFENL